MQNLTGPFSATLTCLFLDNIAKLLPLQSGVIHDTVTDTAKGT